MKCFLLFAAISMSEVAASEMIGDLKILINDAANDFRSAKGKPTYSSEGHESYVSKLELKGCADPSIWKRPNGDLEFTCELVATNSNFNSVSVLLSERIKPIQAGLSSGWKIKTFPHAKPYEDFFIATDHKAHLELNAHIVPYVNDSYNAVLTLKKAGAQTSTLSKDAAQKKLKELGIEYSPTAFFDKISEGVLESVQLFLETGMDPDSRNEEGSSALIVAAQIGFPEIVNLLLDKGADPNLKNHFGKTALFQPINSRDRCFFNPGLDSENARECNQSEVDFLTIFQRLLDADVDPNAKDNGGASALFFAGNDKEIAELLLSNGANVNLKNNQGRTPLMEAVYSDDSDFLELLLKKGADPKIKDNHGKTAVDYAIQIDSEEMMQLLKAAETKSSN